MTRRKLMMPALAAIAGATTLCLPAAANAEPVGPCADVPFIGVCVPPSDQPTPPQQSVGGTEFVPDSSGGIHIVG